MCESTCKVVAYFSLSPLPIYDIYLRTLSVAIPSHLLALLPKTLLSMKSAKFEQFSVGGLGDVTYQMMGEVLAVEMVRNSSLCVINRKLS